MEILDNQLLLPNRKIITFNDEQFDGIKKIRNWLNTEKGNFFTLAGYAGTGKSTIIKKILDSYNLGVVVSAPTHKAKKVIQNTTGREGKTLHSLLGLRPDVELSEFNPNSPIFNPIAICRINDYNWVIIDEASMINKELYDLIVESVKNRRTKILFMGDPAQIPPVHEKISPVFVDNTIIFHQLTKIERQKDTNPLMIVYDTLRNNLNTIGGGFKRQTNINKYNEGVIFTLNKSTFRKAILDRFSCEEFKKDTDYCKVIAWKNDTVMKSNLIIRNELFGEKTDVVEVDDILMGYRSVSSGNQQYNIIENSADYRVVEKNKLEENDYGINGFRIRLRENLPRGEFKFQNVFIIDTSNHDNLHLYAQMHDFFRDIGKSNSKAWKKYYDFRRNNLLMKTINKHRNGLYRSTQDIIQKDMYYGYAITGHKSQGSTYTHAFVMENDINENWDLKERNRILYVALTRPTTTATVLTTKLDN